MLNIVSTQSMPILATYNPQGNISIKASAIGEDLGNTFRTHIVEQKDPRFVYAIARAVTADVPNKNKDMFPLEEIKRAYTTFIGRNIFLDHNTKSVRNAVGKIIAAELREDEAGHTYVACLFKVDRLLHPDIARKIENGIIDSVSMGANVRSTQCLPPQTKLFTPDGQRMIKDIRIGDYVLTHKGRFKPVTATFRNKCPETMVRIKYADGSEDSVFLDLTGNHPVLMESGEWLPARYIQPGDKVMCLVNSIVHISISGSSRTAYHENSYSEYRFAPVEVSSVKLYKTTPKTSNVCNISVADDESYIAENLVVHNCSVCGHSAHTEASFCEHQKNPMLYPDYYAINTGVDFTELSLVSVPADPDAKMHKVFELNNGINKTAIGRDDIDAVSGTEDTEEVSVDDDTQTPESEAQPVKDTIVVEEPKDVPAGLFYQIDCSSNETADLIYNMLYPYINKGVEEISVNGRGIKVKFEDSVKDVERFIDEASALFGLTLERGLESEKVAEAFNNYLYKTAEASYTSSLGDITVGGKTYHVDIKGSQSGRINKDTNEKSGPKVMLIITEKDNPDAFVDTKERLAIKSKVRDALTNTYLFSEVKPVGDSSSQLKFSAVPYDLKGATSKASVHKYLASDTNFTTKVLSAFEKALTSDKETSNRTLYDKVSMVLSMLLESSITDEPNTFAKKFVYSLKELGVDDVQSALSLGKEDIIAQVGKDGYDAAQRIASEVQQEEQNSLKEGIDPKDDPQSIEEMFDNKGNPEEEKSDVSKKETTDKEPVVNQDKVEEADSKPDTEDLNTNTKQDQPAEDKKEVSSTNQEVLEPGSDIENADSVQNFKDEFKEQAIKFFNRATKAGKPADSAFKQALNNVYKFKEKLSPKLLNDLVSILHNISVRRDIETEAPSVYEPENLADVQPEPKFKNETITDAWGDIATKYFEENGWSEQSLSEFIKKNDTPRAKSAAEEVFKAHTGKKDTADTNDRVEEGIDPRPAYLRRKNRTETDGKITREVLEDLGNHREIPNYVLFKHALNYFNKNGFSAESINKYRSVMSGASGIDFVLNTIEREFADEIKAGNEANNEKETKKEESKETPTTEQNEQKETTKTNVSSEKEPEEQTDKEQADSSEEATNKGDTGVSANTATEAVEKAQEQAEKKAGNLEGEIIENGAGEFSLSDIKINNIEPQQVIDEVAKYNNKKIPADVVAIVKNYIARTRSYFEPESIVAGAVMTLKLTNTQNAREYLELSVKKAGSRQYKYTGKLFTENTNLDVSGESATPGTAINDACELAYSRLNSASSAETEGTNTEPKEAPENTKNEGNKNEQPRKGGILKK